MIWLIAFGVGVATMLIGTWGIRAIDSQVYGRRNDQVIVKEIKVEPGTTTYSATPFELSQSPAFQRAARRARGE